MSPSVAASLQMLHPICCSSMANGTCCLLQLHCKCHTLSVVATFRISHYICCSSTKNAILCLLQHHCKCHTLFDAAQLQMANYLYQCHCKFTLCPLQLHCKCHPQSVSASFQIWHSICCSSIENAILCLFQNHCKCHSICFMHFNCKCHTLFDAVHFNCHTLSGAAPLHMSQSVCCRAVAHVTLFLMQLHCKWHT